MMLTMNSERFFSKGVLDALEQALTGYEYSLLVVDGGSTDNTVNEVKRKFGDKSAVIQVAERNLAVCRNVALENVPQYADFYCFIDSDIIIPQNFFDRLLPLFYDPKVGSAEIHAGLCGSFVADFYNETKTHQVKGVREGGGATVCMMMRPEVAKTIRFDTRFKRAGEDLDFHWKIIEQGYKTLHDSNKPYAVHVREPSIMEELKRIKHRGVARESNLILHGGVVTGRGINGTLASACITIASWVLFINGLLFSFPLFLFPLFLLLVNQMRKLKRFWRIDLAVFGLLLSLVYLTGFLYAFWCNDL